MSAFFGSLELAMALLRELYGAKNQEQYCLRMAALSKTMKADRLVALAAKVSGRPTQKPQTTWSNMGSENAKTRRLRKRAEATRRVKRQTPGAASKPRLRRRSISRGYFRRCTHRTSSSGGHVTPQSNHNWCGCVVCDCARRCAALGKGAFLCKVVMIMVIAKISAMPSFCLASPEGGLRGSASARPPRAGQAGPGRQVSGERPALSQHGCHPEGPGAASDLRQASGWAPELTRARLGSRGNTHTWSSQGPAAGETTGGGDTGGREHDGGQGSDQMRDGRQGGEERQGVPSWAEGQRERRRC
jgi:hypothetical protein